MFDEIPGMTFQDIKETKGCRRMDNVKTVYSPQTQFAGGIIIFCSRCFVSQSISMINMFIYCYYLRWCELYN